MENEPRMMLPALYFTAESMAEVADKLNEMVGDFYKDRIGNVFRLTGFYHFQAVRVEEWHVGEPGSTSPPGANVVYDVVVLPVYEHVEWLSKTLTMSEVTSAMPTLSTKN